MNPNPNSNPNPSDLGGVELQATEEQKRQNQQQEKLVEITFGENTEEKQNEKKSEIKQQLYTVKVPQKFLDGITNRPMCDPVSLNGRNYEREVIQGWVSTAPIDPVTSEPVQSENITPNQNLQDEITAFFSEVLQDPVLKESQYSNALKEIQRLAGQQNENEIEALAVDNPAVEHIVVDLPAAPMPAVRLNNNPHYESSFWGIYPMYAINTAFGATMSTVCSSFLFPFSSLKAVAATAMCTSGAIALSDAMALLKYWWSSNTMPPDNTYCCSCIFPSVFTSLLHGVVAPIVVNTISSEGKSFLRTSNAVTVGTASLFCAGVLACCGFFAHAIYKGPQRRDERQALLDHQAELPGDDAARIPRNNLGPGSN